MNLYTRPLKIKVEEIMLHFDLKYKEKLKLFSFPNKNRVLFYDLVQTSVENRYPLSPGQFKVLDFYHDKLFFQKNKYTDMKFYFDFLNFNQKKENRTIAKRAELIFDKLSIEFNMEYVDSFKIKPECLRFFFQIIKLKKDESNFRSFFIKMYNKNFNNL